jgi:hypothetical protein
MPIKHLVADATGGTLVQICAGCGAEHTISLNRGGLKSKTGPYSFSADVTLVVRIDRAVPQTITIRTAAFSNPAGVTAAELALHLREQLPAARVCDDAGGVLIDSATIGEHSHVEVVSGSACAPLGFHLHGDGALGCGRLVLGVQIDATMHDPNVIALRRCNDCGANECLVRTFDTAPVEHHNTHFQRHRCAVNALAQHARAHGWSHPALVAHHAAETHEPPDIDHSFPASPLRLDRVPGA